MSAAEARAPSGDPPAGGSVEASTGGRSKKRWSGQPWPWWAALAGVLALALGLRLWGIREGLPYAYNADENAHFVPRAIGMFVLGGNPHYFANPPALTYLLHGVFAVWFGGRAGVSRTFALDPTEVFVVARVTVALLGTLAVWLLYLFGARLFDRRVGLLAAALGAVAFLPVFYSHLALNDVPTLAPLTLSLLGSAGVLRSGRPRDYALAGIGLGLGCATKYTAGIVFLPLLAAAALRYLDALPRTAATPSSRAPSPEGSPRRVLTGLALAGGAALVSFLIANPYALLDPGAFHAGLTHQSQVSEEAQGKLGAGHSGALLYYLWSLGWVPALAALGGAVRIWWRDPRLGWFLVPAPVLYLAFMGLQGRYFGRWLLPIFPILCVLAAFFALELVDALVRRLAGPGEPPSGAPPGGRRPGVSPPRASWLRPALLGLAVLALCAQGLYYSVHSDRVLARADTRNLARAWMVAHVPLGTKVVIEPILPDAWAQDVGRALPTERGYRWVKYRTLLSVIDPAGAIDLEAERSVSLEDYERTLSPALIPYYESRGFCWVLTGSTQSGRALAEPGAVPHAIAYYRALASQAEVAYRVSPYAPGARGVPFNFDWSFDYYPRAYERPGPEIAIYRLRGPRCARG
jgi:hypothetical protein